MKFIKKFNFITLLIITILSMNLSIVNATTDCSAKFKLTLSSSNVNVGDEISVVLNISSVSGFDGIHLLVAKKVYNSNIFEYIGCYPQNGWKLKGDGANILLQRDAGDVKTGAICTLKFKVLNFANNSTITLSNIDATGNNGDVYFEDNNVNSPSVNIKITEVLQEPIVVEEEKVTTNRGSNDSTTRIEEVEDDKQTETKTSQDVGQQQNNNYNYNNNNITNSIAIESGVISNENNSNNTIISEVENIINNTIEESTTDLVTENSDYKVNVINNSSSTNIETSTSNNNIVKTIITTLLSGGIISVIIYCFIIKK